MGKVKYTDYSFGDISSLNDFMIDSNSNLYDIKLINFYLNKFKKRINVHKKQKKFITSETIRNIQSDIIDAQSYFLASKIPEYEFKDTANTKEFKNYFERTILKSDILNQNLSLLKDSLTYGQGYELVYYEFDKDLNDVVVKFTNINPQNCFILFSNDNNQKILSAFILSSFEDYKSKEVKYTLKQITKDKIVDYELTKGLNITKKGAINVDVNIANKVLISISKCNTENKPTYSPTLNSILRLDYIDKLQDEFLYQSVNPLIILENLDIILTEEQEERGITKQDIINEAKEKGLIILNSSGGFGENKSNIEILASKINLQDVTAIATILETDIKQRNGLVDMSNTLKSNASADSMKFKFVDLDRKVSNIEPFFRMALQNRIQIIINIYNYYNPAKIVDVEDVSFSFIKNTTILKDENEKESEEFLDSKLG